MVTIGMDVHTPVHQAVALDDYGALRGSWRGANTSANWQHLLAWTSILPGPRLRGVEGAWNDGRGVAQFLVAYLARLPRKP